MRGFRVITAFLMAMAAVAVIPSSAVAATHVGGIITTDTTWALAGTPYIMDASVTVQEGVTLTIEPGVRVETSCDCGLFVQGTLSAAGTRDSLISFYRVGIEFLSSNSESADSSSVLSHAVVERAPYAGVEVVSDAPTISEVTFRGNDYGLQLSNPAADITIANNRFIRNRWALAGHGSNTMSLLSNDFWDNHYSLQLSGTWEIHGNDIIDDTVDADVFTGSAAVNGTDNWWGTTDLVKIERRIDHSYDDPSNGTFVYEPVSTSPNTAWPPLPTTHVTTTTLSLRKHLRALGQVTASDGFTACGRIKVEIQRKSETSWVKVKGLETSGTGRFATSLRDRAGTYRAVAASSTIGDPPTDTCAGSKSPRRSHRH